MNHAVYLRIIFDIQKSAFLSRPGFKYSEGGFSVANVDLEESWQHPALIETSSQLDNYYIRNSHLLPDHVRELCQVQGSHEHRYYSPGRFVLRN